MAWRLAECSWRDKARLDALLREGWEPFAVTVAADGPAIWLRRPAEPAMAGIADDPWQRLEVAVTDAIKKAGS